MHAGRSGRVMDTRGGNTIEFLVRARIQSSGAVVVVPVNMCSRVGVSISYLDRPAEAGCRGEPAVNGYPPTRQTAEAHKTQPQLRLKRHSGNMMGGETLILPLHARPMYPLSAQPDRWGRWWVLRHA